MAVSFEKKLDLIRKANATLKKEKITTLLGQASKIDSYSSENQTKIKGNVDSLYNQIAQAYAQKKKAVAQANAPTTKTRKKPKKEDTMMGYASMIMKRDNITWKQALKKSKDHFADLRTKKQDAEKKALEDFEKKVGAVEFEKATRYKIRGGTKGTDIERDKVRPALPSGKRIVRTKGKTTNQYGTYNNKIGKVYYEKRANRMDVNQPSKSVYPKLADGGTTSSLASIKRKYLKNEDENAHSENVVLLAKHFGDAEDLKLAKQILAWHKFDGHLSSINVKERNELHFKLIEKARAKFGEEGIEFAQGGEVVSEIENKYELAGKDSGGVWTYSKITADEIAKKYKGSVQEDGSNWYVSLNKFAKGGEIAESNRNMALNKAKELCHHVDELHNVLKGKKHIEAWVIAKLERASSDLSDVTHYLDGLSEQKTH